MNKNLQRIRYFLDDKEKKPYPKIFKEVVNLWFLKKEFPKHYFGRFFYRKDAPDCRDFMTMPEYYEILESKNFKSPSIDLILNNKLSFDIFCEKNNIPRAKVLSYNFNASFFLNNKKHIITSHKELEKYFISILETEKLEGLFLKPIHGQQGKGALLIKKNSISKNSLSIWENLKDKSYIHQEIISQHQEINTIYSKTVNTLRFETYVDNTQKVHLLGCYMRFGSGGAIVDNVSSGGFFVSVDIENGILFEKGATNMISGSKVCLKHPETEFVFKGFKIPYFDEAKSLVFNVASFLPGRILGWDIAITNTGPIVIEGNVGPGLLGGEFSYNGFKNKPIFKEIIEEAKR